MEMRRREKLAVFDLDGTLFDTTQVNYFSYQAAAEQFGYEIAYEEFSKVFVGRNYKEFLPILGVKERETQEKIHETKKKKYAMFLERAKKNEHLFSVIPYMKEEYFLAVATTASKRNAEEILSCFKVKELFDFFITQEDVKNLKPDPECYLTAMKMAGIAADRTLIFEDSDVGIAAARASGAAVFRIECF